jgi:adenosine deaminase
LRLFLHAMPKGGDLHNHLSGALYAEDMIAWAGAKGLCLAPDGAASWPPPCAPARPWPMSRKTGPRCMAPWSTASRRAAGKPGSMPGAVDGHDQFFATFARFDPAVIGSEAAAMVALRRQAAGEGVLYLELIHNPPALLQARSAAPAVALDAQAGRFLRREAPHWRARCRRCGRRSMPRKPAPQGKACGTAQAEPGCAVAVHYQAWALRSVPPAAVFRSMILAFALADKDPRFVGVNIVAPEDWPVARADYDLHMAMFRFLAQRHPGVAVSMHAGELAFGRCRRPILPIISPRRWLRGAADRPWRRHRLEDQGRERWPAWRAKASPWRST